MEVGVAAHTWGRGPERPPSFGCPRLGVSLGGPSWAWRVWTRAEGPGTASPVGGGGKLTQRPQNPVYHPSPTSGPKSAQAPGM